MKSKKWTLLATSLTAMVLMVACSQSTTKSNTNATTNSATTSATKTNQSSYFTERTMILLMMKAQLLRLSYLAHQQTSLEMG